MMLHQPKDLTMTKAKSKSPVAPTSKCGRSLRDRSRDSKNSGTLEKVRDMANYADTRTTQVYDPRSEDVALDDVEWIII